MSPVAERLKQVLNQLPNHVQLVAVSKYHAEPRLQEAYEAGQRVFGESRVQEMTRKAEALPKDIRWHFIGHLQTNKVKYIAPFISLIETVDSQRLLQEINRQGARAGRVLDVLLELHLAKEETKSGLTPDECRQLLEQGEWRDMEHVRIRGLMMMASNTDDEGQIRQEMQQAACIFDEFKQSFFSHDSAFSLRSWGMSSDYGIALHTGSNMVRIGTAIFGEREY